MNIGDCYQLLGLKLGASLAEVKASYRYLARQYHPDTNSADQQAQTKFIEVTNAYKFLLSVVELSRASNQPNQARTTSTTTSSSSQAESTRRSPDQSDPAANGSRNNYSGPNPVRATRKEAPVQASVNLSKAQQLKRDSYHQLQQLLKHQQFSRATALIEALAQRLPQDSEVRQWQAITYQCWGRYYLHQKQLDKARGYLKKALRTDPHNKVLWVEVERDFLRIEQAL